MFCETKSSTAGKDRQDSKEQPALERLEMEKLVEQEGD